jgi:GT2 family glycosyltransferase
MPSRAGWRREGLDMPRGVRARPGAVDGRLRVSRLDPASADTSEPYPLFHRVSIVLLTYNCAARLDPILDDILGAGVPVIAVDNASTDATVAVLQARAGVDVVALKENTGAAARNVGAEHARTPYIAFCDDDTWYERDGLVRAAQLFDAHERLGLLTGRILVGDDEVLDPISEEMAGSPLPESAGIPGAVLVSYMGGASVARRTAFLGVGGYDARFFMGGEEELVGWQLLRAGWEMRYVPDVVVHHLPSLANFGGMRTYGIRNSLWTSWLSLSAPAAASWTWHILRSTRKDRVLLRGLVMAVGGAGWVAREREPLPARYEAMIRMLRGRASRARRFGTAE